MGKLYGGDTYGNTRLPYLKYLVGSTEGLGIGEEGRGKREAAVLAAGRCNGDRRELRMPVQPRAGSGIFRQLVRDGESSILTLIM